MNSLSQIKASPLSESDITMNLSKYLKQNRSKSNACVRKYSAQKYFEIWVRQITPYWYQAGFEQSLAVAERLRQVEFEL